MGTVINGLFGGNKLPTVQTGLLSAPQRAGLPQQSQFPAPAPMPAGLDYEAGRNWIQAYGNRAGVLQGYSQPIPGEGTPIPPHQQRGGAAAPQAAQQAAPQPQQSSIVPPGGGLLGDVLPQSRMFSEANPNAHLSALDIGDLLNAGIIQPMQQQQQYAGNAYPSGQRARR